jgi:hypothetical protein
MEVLLEDIKRTLGAKRIYLPGSAEEAKYMTRINKLALRDNKEDGGRVEELEVAVEGLAIDLGVDGMGVAATVTPASKRSRLGLGMLSTGGDSDKENLPVLRRSIVKVSEGARGQLEMVGVP